MVTLYDHRGMPVKTGELVREHAAPSMTGIRTIWNETVASGLTPVRLAALLRSAAEGDHHAFLTLAEEMEERDLHYAGELSKRKLAVSRLPLSVESASDESRHKAHADAVRGMIKRPGFRWLLKDLLDAVGKGYSVVEILWKRGSFWEPDRYEWRDPRFFQFDQESRRKIRLRDEADMMNGVDLAPYKYLVHIHRSKSGIPIRGGAARLAAWAFMCKSYTLKDWLAFAEVFGMPLRVGKYGTTAKPEEIDILKMAVANLGTDAAAVFPESMRIELTEAGNKTGAGEFFRGLANYLDDQVSKGILGQTASSSGTPGKLGNDTLQAEVRDDIRDDDAEALEDTINRDLVQPFIELNFGPQDVYPSVQIRAVKKEDIKALVESVVALIPFGLTVENSVMLDKLGLPDPDPKAKPEDILRAQDAGAGAGVSVAANRQIAVAMNAEKSGGTDVTDVLFSWAKGETTAHASEMIEKARDLLEHSETLEAFKDRLMDLYAETEPEALGEAMARIDLLSRMAGRMEAMDE